MKQHQISIFHVIEIVAPSRGRELKRPSGGRSRRWARRPLAGA